MERVFRFLIMSLAIGAALVGRAHADEATALLLTDATVAAEVRSNWDVALQSDGVKLVPADQVSAAMAFTSADPSTPLGEPQIASLREKLGAATALVVTTKPLADGKLAIEVAAHRADGVRREYATAAAAELQTVTLPLLLRLAHAPATVSTPPQPSAPVPTTTSAAVVAPAASVQAAPAAAPAAITQVDAVAAVAVPRGPQTHRKAFLLMNVPGEAGGVGLGFRAYRPVSSSGYEIGADLGFRSGSTVVDAMTGISMDAFTVPFTVNARMTRTRGRLAFGTRIGAGIQFRRESVPDTEMWKLYLSPGALFGLDFRFALGAKVSFLFGADLSVSAHNELVTSFGLAF